MPVQITFATRHRRGQLHRVGTQLACSALCAATFAAAPVPETGHARCRRGRQIAVGVVPRIGAQLAPPERWLTTPFRVIDGRIAALTPGIATIPETVELFLISGQRAFRISNIRRLRGHVQVRSAAEALAFARLTNAVPGTPAIPAEFASGTVIEIMARNKVTLATTYGDAHDEHLLKAMPNGAWGIVPSTNTDAGTHLNALLATCSASGAGYIVRRTVVTDAPDLLASAARYRVNSEQHVYRICEFVGRNGAYHKLSTERLHGRLPYVYSTLVYGQQ